MHNIEYDIERTERGINSLGEKFIKWPYNFFTESDAHSFLYYYFLRSAHSSLKDLYPSCDDAYKSILVHREYPTIFRFKRDEMELSSEGDRGHYDLAVLNPRFIEDHSIKTVIAKDHREVAKGTGDHLLAAVEFKFICRTPGKRMRDEIAKDAKKLYWSINLEPPQSKNAYLLVFNRHRHSSALVDDLVELSSLYPEVKMLYIESTIDHEENKKVEKYKKVVFHGAWKRQAPFLLKYSG